MRVLTLTPPVTPPRCRVAIPGSKSYTNRALIVASLATGESILTGISASSDSSVLCNALRLLGIEIRSDSDSTLVINGGIEKLVPHRGTIDVGPAGTAMRFLTALCAAIPGADIVLQGTERMHQRPIGALVETLRQAGATIDYLGTEGCPPLRIHSYTSLNGDSLTIDGSTSSQFISALTLIAPMFKGGLELSISGEETSTSYLDMTLQSVREFGVAATREGYRSLTIAPGVSYSPRQYHIEGDTSGASYLWALAAVSGGSVTVDNINPRSAQGDIMFPRLLERMGCTVVETDQSISVTGPSTLQAIDASMERMPDTAQTLAVVASCARGTTTIRGLKTLRVKETDRISALVAELSKLGVQTEAGPDYLVVHGTEPRGARIATYEDHRMAMSFAALGARVRGMRIEEPEVVAKSFPDFWETLARMDVTVNDCASELGNALHD